MNTNKAIEKRVLFCTTRTTIARTTISLEDLQVGDRLAIFPKARKLSVFDSKSRILLVDGLSCPQKICEKFFSGITLTIEEVEKVLLNKYGKKIKLFCESSDHFVLEVVDI